MLLLQKPSQFQIQHVLLSQELGQRELNIKKTEQDPGLGLEDELKVLGPKTVPDLKV